MLTFLKACRKWIGFQTTSKFAKMVVQPSILKILCLSNIVIDC